MGKMGDWLKKKTEEGRQEIEEKVSDKLMEEKLNPTLPEHKGGPVPGKEKD